ncbi:MAG: response regulator [bacterium]
MNKIKTVLLADDNKSLRDYYKIILSKYNVEIISASSPKDFIQILIDDFCKIDLAYIDVSYDGSDIDGFQLAGIVKNLVQPFPFFIMSMSHSSEYIKKTEDIGALGFIEKNDKNIIESYASLYLLLQNWKPNKKYTWTLRKEKHPFNGHVFI